MSTKPVKISCKVKHLKKLTPQIFELAFETEPEVSFIAGQFISILIPNAGPKGRNLRRAYSFASSPDVRPFELCIQIIEDGPGTQYLSQLKPGECFEAQAPFGKFVYESTPERRVCFISTATGLAPFRSILISKSYLAQPAKEVSCLFGIRHLSEMLYEADLSNRDDIQWVPCITKPEDNWDGFKGRVTDYLRTLPDSYPWKETDFYLCGNGAMIKEVKEILKEKGLSKEQIFHEAYF